MVQTRPSSRISRPAGSRQGSISANSKPRPARKPTKPTKTSAATGTSSTNISPKTSSSSSSLSGLSRRDNDSLRPNSHHGSPSYLNNNDASNPDIRTSSHHTQANQANPNDAGSNIKVVVRCRGRTDREIKAKSHVVVQTLPSSPTEVLIEDVSKASQEAKIYKVDQVFGPEADQATIYDEVVSPMVTEVLAGMNCTIFAYGQTGTGKT